jgi:DNA-binding transcriptional regulator GbsR (MarR family)
MLSKKQKELIEKIGIYFEQGMQPAAARILSLLIVSDQDSYSFDEIRENLKLSKSATSNGINFLLGVNKIEYFTVTGDRKRYFKWNPIYTLKHFKEGIDKVLGLSSLFQETIQLKKNKDSFNALNLIELSDFMNFLHKELPTIFKNWENSKVHKVNQK